MNDGANFLAVESELNISFLPKVKNDDGDIVIHAETKCGGVHDPELVADALAE